MFRGEMDYTYEWDVAGGELRTLEDLHRAMMALEPAERPIADQFLRSECMVKWACPRGRDRKRRSIHPADEMHEVARFQIGRKKGRPICVILRIQQLS